MQGKKKKKKREHTPGETARVTTGRLIRGKMNRGEKLKEKRKGGVPRVWKRVKACRQTPREKNDSGQQVTHVSGGINSKVLPTSVNSLLRGHMFNGVKCTSAGTVTKGT